MNRGGAMMGPLEKLTKEAIVHSTYARVPDHFLAHPRFIADCYKAALQFVSGPVCAAGGPTVCGYRLTSDDAIPYGELVEVM